MKPSRLVVDPIACDGYGICQQLFPERIGLDDWGFPILSDAPISGADARNAKRAVGACPRLALRLVPVPPAAAPPRQHPPAAGSRPVRRRRPLNPRPST